LGWILITGGGAALGGAPKTPPPRLRRQPTTASENQTTPLTGLNPSGFRLLAANSAVGRFWAAARSSSRVGRTFRRRASSPDLSVGLLASYCQTECSRPMAAHGSSLHRRRQQTRRFRSRYFTKASGMVGCCPVVLLMPLACRPAITLFETTSKLVVANFTCEKPGKGLEALEARLGASYPPSLSPQIRARPRLRRPLRAAFRDVGPICFSQPPPPAGRGG